jgi:transcriptional regulator with XRE-family HTH domain
MIGGGRLILQPLPVHYFRSKSTTCICGSEATGVSLASGHGRSVHHHRHGAAPGGAVIGRYERDEVKPSIEMAAAIAEALEVSLDYLVGNTDLLLEKTVVNKIVDIQKLNSENRAHVFALLDAFLQSHKAKKVFAS